MTQAKSHYSKLNILLFLGSSFLQSAFYWALTIYISKTYGISVLGEYSYALAILSPLTVLGGLQLKSYLLTKTDSDIKRQVKWLRFSFSSGLLLLALLTLLWLEPWIVSIFLPLALLKWSELWSDLAHGFMQLESGLVQVNKAIFIRYSAAFLCLVFIWALDLDLKMGLGIIALMSCLVAFIDHFKSGLNQVPMIVRDSRPTFNTTLSLSLSALLTALLLNIPRYLLKEYHSMEMVGTFSMLLYYYVIPSMVVNYACQGLLKQMNGLSHHRAFLPFTMMTIGILSLCYFVVLYLSGNQMTTALYGTSPEWDLQLTLLITGTFLLGGLASIMHYALLGRNIYGIQLRTNIVSACTTLICGLLLIGKMAVVGAFISFILGLLIQSTVYIIAFSKLKNE
jgi:O-antigen/teichoic acid export membrane protein